MDPKLGHTNASQVAEKIPKYRRILSSGKSKGLDIASVVGIASRTPKRRNDNSTATSIACTISFRPQLADPSHVQHGKVLQTTALAKTIPDLADSFVKMKLSHPMVERVLPKLP